MHHSRRLHPFGSQRPAGTLAGKPTASAAPATLIYELTPPIVTKTLTEKTISSNSLKLLPESIHLLLACI